MRALLEDEDWEPTPAWVSATLGVSLDDAEWLLVLYRFQPTGEEEGPRYRYYCEAL
jgi:hypothetical protein